MPCTISGEWGYQASGGSAARSPAYLRYEEQPKQEANTGWELARRCESGSKQ